MACRSGCPTPGVHRTWGECARAADLQIDRHSLSVDLRLEKDKDHRLSRYEDARRQGLHPKSTQWRDVRNAFENGTDRPSVDLSEIN